MKYIITERQFNELIDKNDSDKIIKSMEKFFEMSYKNIELPLGIFKHKGPIAERNKFFNIPDGKFLFIQYHDRDKKMQIKWLVDISLEPIERMFGKENFEKFILKHFKLDITDKGKKIDDWDYANINPY